MSEQWTSVDGNEAAAFVFKRALDVHGMSGDEFLKYLADDLDLNKENDDG